MVVILVFYDVVLDEVVEDDVDDLVHNDITLTVILDICQVIDDDELELDENDAVGLADELDEYENVAVYLDNVNGMLDDDELEFIT
jgi:hypothetical protein